MMGKLGMRENNNFTLITNVTISASKMQFFTAETLRAKIFSTGSLKSQSSSFSQGLGSGYTELTHPK